MSDAQTPTAEPDAQIVLDANLDLRAAAPLVEALRAHRGQDVDLVAADVRRLGGLCLQVLLVAVRTWAEDGRALRFIDPSPAFVSHLRLFGVNRAAA